jgi:predicted transcriptional regulator
VGNCNVWRFRSELRRLHGLVAQGNYQNMLLNTLKNERRLRILTMLSRNASSIVQLQKELKGFGYCHSQETIMSEYVEPLIAAGLVVENSNHFRATTFGSEVGQLLAGLAGVEDALPPHSECYEERMVEALFESPKTYEELKLIIPTESLKRAIARLLKANLITINGNDNYVFYFRTKRSPDKEKLSITERRVYESIPDGGVAAEKLAEKTNITLRRAYKHIRKLRGKKLVFKRKRPKTYALTTDGMRIAVLLQKLYALLKEYTQVAGIVAKTFEAAQQIPLPDASGDGKEKPLRVLVRSGV